jgi:hypothetical protein
MNPLQLSAADWPTFSALLDQALELPVAQRASWLHALTDEHARYRDTLRQLLTHATGVETDHFLGKLPHLGALADGSLTEPVPGAAVGPYRLLAELGSGGMGTVWLAERADGTLRRKVALKLPRLAWATGLAERMAHERDILATLEHPNIARLYDAGVDQHGRPYLALEYVEGEPIDKYVRQRMLSVRQILDLLLQVCVAVSFAHSRLVVHRDLKPSNILVTADGQVRLLDFGIAKLVEGHSDTETPVTRLAGRALTLDYASPEQINGEPIGTASDVYSLGVVAYELLTGVKPYRLKRGTAAELEDAIASVDAPRASDAAIQADAKKALKGDLDAILNKALKKVPAQRYASVDALAQDFTRHVRHEAVSARPDALGYRISKFLQRYRGQAVAAAAVVVALVAGTVIALAEARRAQAQAERAEREQRRAGDVGNFMLNLIGRVAANPAADNPAARQHMAAVVQAELDRLEATPDGDPGGRAEIWGAMASVFNYLQRPDDQFRAAQKELDYLERAVAPAIRIAEAHRQIALAHARRGDIGAAILQVQRGLAVLNPSDDGEQVLQLRLHRALARYTLARGDLIEAEHASMAALESFGRIKAPTRGTAIHHYGSAAAERATVLSVMARDDDALALLATVDRQYAGRSDLKESDRADIELARGRVLLAMGWPAKAADAFRRAGDLYRPQFGAHGSNAAIVDGHLAQALMAAGRFDEAEALLSGWRQTSELLQLESAQLALLRGDLAAADGLLRSLEQNPKYGDALPARRFRVQLLRGQWLLDAKGAAAALPSLRESAALAQKQLPGAIRWQREAAAAIVQAHLAAGDVSEADRQFTHACGDGAQGLDAAAERLLCTDLGAEVRLAAGDPRSALEHFGQGAIDRPRTHGAQLRAHLTFGQALLRAGQAENARKQYVLAERLASSLHRAAPARGRVSTLLAATTGTRGQ